MSYLYQTQEQSPYVFICNLRKTAIKPRQASSPFLCIRSCCHALALLYVASGYQIASQSNTFRVINPQGDSRRLAPMIIGKRMFYMVYFELKRELITLGGNYNSNMLNDTTLYSIKKDRWSALT